MALKNFVFYGVATLLWFDYVSASLRGALRGPWVEHTGARRYQRDVVRRRADPPSGAMNSSPLHCQAPAPEVKAPKDNVWDPLSHVETASILEWLFHQKELNLTITPPKLNGTGAPNETVPQPESAWDNRV